MPTSHRALATLLLLLSLALALVLSRARPPGRASSAAALATLLLSGAWLSLKEAYEGPTVINAGFGHGLAAADLGVPPAVALSLAVLIKAWRARAPSAVAFQSMRSRRALACGVTRRRSM